MSVRIYTDGAARGNPGPGGYGAIVIQGTRRREFSEGFRYTTNNRMELLAVIVGLEALPPKQQVVVYADAKYVVDAVNQGWLHNWLRTNFKGKKNADLWLRFWHVFQQHQVTLHWIKGHAGHPENERCDALAVQRAHCLTQKIDHVYERENRLTKKSHLL